MPVIREERQYQIGPIGVARVYESQQGQVIAQAANRLSAQLYQRGAEDAQEQGLSMGQAVQREHVLTIDPKTGEPVALKAMGEMGRIGSRAYESVIRTRFRQSIDEEIQNQGRIFAAQYNGNPDAYTTAMDGYIQSMARHATGEYGGYIMDVGTSYLNRTRAALVAQSFARIRAAAASGTQNSNREANGLLEDLVSQAGISFLISGANESAGDMTVAQPGDLSFGSDAGQSEREPFLPFSGRQLRLDEAPALSFSGRSRPDGSPIIPSNGAVFASAFNRTETGPSAVSVTLSSVDRMNTEAFEAGIIDANTRDRFSQESRQAIARGMVRHYATSVVNLNHPNALAHLETLKGALGMQDFGRIGATASYLRPLDSLLGGSATALEDIETAVEGILNDAIASARPAHEQRIRDEALAQTRLARGIESGNSVIGSQVDAIIADGRVGEIVQAVLSIRDLNTNPDLSPELHRAHTNRVEIVLESANSSLASSIARGLNREEIHELNSAIQSRDEETIAELAQRIPGAIDYYNNLVALETVDPNTFATQRTRLNEISQAEGAYLSYAQEQVDDRRDAAQRARDAEVMAAFDASTNSIAASAQTDNLFRVASDPAAVGVGFAALNRELDKWYSYLGNELSDADRRRIERRIESLTTGVVDGSIRGFLNGKSSSEIEEIQAAVIGVNSVAHLEDQYPGIAALQISIHSLATRDQSVLGDVTTLMSSISTNEGSVAQNNLVAQQTLELANGIANISLTGLSGPELEAAVASFDAAARTYVHAHGLDAALNELYQQATTASLTAAFSLLTRQDDVTLAQAYLNGRNAEGLSDEVRGHLSDAIFYSTRTGQQSYLSTQAGKQAETQNSLIAIAEERTEMARRAQGILRGEPMLGPDPSNRARTMADSDLAYPNASAALIVLPSDQLPEEEQNLRNAILNNGSALPAEWYRVFVRTAHQPDANSEMVLSAWSQISHTLNSNGTTIRSNVWHLMDNEVRVRLDSFSDALSLGASLQGLIDNMPAPATSPGDPNAAVDRMAALRGEDVERLSERINAVQGFSTLTESQQAAILSSTFRAMENSQAFGLPPIDYLQMIEQSIGGLMGPDDGTVYHRTPAGLQTQTRYSLHVIFPDPNVREMFEMVVADLASFNLGRQVSFARDMERPFGSGLPVNPGGLMGLANAGLSISRSLVAAMSPTPEFSQTFLLSPRGFDGDVAVYGIVQMNQMGDIVPIFERVPVRVERDTGDMLLLRPVTDETPASQLRPLTVRSDHPHFMFLRQSAIDEEDDFNRERARAQIELARTLTGQNTYVDEDGQISAGSYSFPESPQVVDRTPASGPSAANELLTGEREPSVPSTGPSVVNSWLRSFFRLDD